MKKLINKNGLEIPYAGKPVFEELMRGTGCVMADKLSMFLESETFNEKFIVLVRSPEGTGAPEVKKFRSANFKDAWVQFTGWMGEAPSP